MSFVSGLAEFTDKGAVTIIGGVHGAIRMCFATSPRTKRTQHIECQLLSAYGDLSAYGAPVILTSVRATRFVGGRTLGVWVTGRR